jgi:tubulin monoglycylase TTLL15
MMNGKIVDNSTRGFKKFKAFRYILFVAFVVILSLIFYASYKRNIQLSLDCEKLRFWGVDTEIQWNDNKSMYTMNKVFKKMNFEFVNNADEFDVAWTIETPYQKGEKNKIFTGFEKKKLKKHQKLNHFPGILNLVSKADMAYNNRDLKYILPSFQIPTDIESLKKFIKKNPKKKVLEKNLYNRGVRIITTKDIKTDTKDEVYYQQFMDNPFLIDGHAFDFGVYVLITSVNPLRIYRYFGDNFIRFCAEKYHPFDAKNTNKYVVNDNSVPSYLMPTFKMAHEKFKFSTKIIFENEIQRRGFNVTDFWTRIDDAIVSIVINSEDMIIDAVIIYTRFQVFL